MVDINKIVFSNKPKEIVEIINALTESEVMNTSISTIERIVLEVGKSRDKGGSDKVLNIARKFIAGNSWNSTVDGIEMYNGKFYINFYVQYGDCETDTNLNEPLSDFIGNGDYRGTIKGSDRYGNTKYYYYSYDVKDKIKVIRSVLLDYVYKKYADELRDNALIETFDELVSRLKASGGKDHEDFLNFVLSTKYFRRDRDSGVTNPEVRQGPYGTKLLIKDTFFFLRKGVEWDMSSYFSAMSYMRRHKYVTTQEPTLLVEHSVNHYNGGQGTDYSYKFGGDEEWKMFTELALDGFAKRFKSVINMDYE